MCKTIKTTICVFFVLCLIISCGKSGENIKKLNGKWQSDAEMTLKNNSETRDKVNKLIKSGVIDEEQVKKLFESSIIIFDVPNKKIDMTFKMMNINESKSFSVDSDKGDKIVIKVDGERLIIIFRNDNEFTLTINDQGMVFRKING
jgi:hypothetical protein